MTAGPLVVVVTLPPDIGHGHQLLVRTDPDGNPTVALRGGPRMAWTPIAHLGGTYEVRTA